MHACLRALLSAGCVVPNEIEAVASTVSCEVVVVNENPGVPFGLLRGFNLRRLFGSARFLGVAQVVKNLSTAGHMSQGRAYSEP